LRGGFRQLGAGRQFDGLLVDGDDGLFIRVVAEQQPHLSRHRRNWHRQAGGIRGGGLAQRQIGDRPLVLTGKPEQRRPI
jgi:hypothetical protein